MIKATGKARLHAKNSTKTIYIDANDVQWVLVSSHNRAMGIERVWEGRPKSGPFSFLSWTVTEYPENTTNEVSHSFGGGVIIEDFNFEFE